MSEMTHEEMVAAVRNASITIDRLTAFHKEDAELNESLMQANEKLEAQLAARNAVIEKARAIRHLIVGSRGRFCSTECLGTCPECRAIAEFEAALAAGGT